MIQYQAYSGQQAAADFFGVTFMQICFPDTPLYQGWGQPLRVESTCEGLQLVEGVLK